MSEKRKLQWDHILDLMEEMTGMSQFVEGKMTYKCWRKQILFWGEFREQVLDQQIVSWSLFWAASTGLMVEQIQLWFLSWSSSNQRADTDASAGVGFWLVPPFRKQTATRKETSLLLSQSKI